MYVCVYVCLYTYVCICQRRMIRRKVKPVGTLVAYDSFEIVAIDVLGWVYYW